MTIGKLPTASTPRPSATVPSATVDYTTAFAMSMSAGAAHGQVQGDNTGAPATAPHKGHFSGGGGGGGVDYMHAHFKNLQKPQSGSSSPSGGPRGNRVYTGKPAPGGADFMTAFAAANKVNGLGAGGRLYDAKPALVKEGAQPVADAFTSFATSVKDKTGAVAAGKVYAEKQALAKSGSTAVAVDVFTAFAMKQQRQVQEGRSSDSEKRTSFADAKATDPADPASPRKLAASPSGAVADMVRRSDTLTAAALTEDSARESLAPPSPAFEAPPTPATPAVQAAPSPKLSPKPSPKATPAPPAAAAVAEPKVVQEAGDEPYEAETEPHGTATAAVVVAEAEAEPEPAEEAEAAVEAVAEEAAAEDEADGEIEDEATGAEEDTAGTPKAAQAALKASTGKKSKSNKKKGR
ncbi:hypothetical protein T492DRAFT_981657 [Pavlovales sp. CCMP2436]|nr:hypothetical protein T492DRAFT_981657 [Pavlovales sp. CCMP2436]|mmetsp:Transcript_38774/g.91037  ORF Transcript_38774/g.91037 Transcript_38774/m.91037 type:complete len:407 (-) Transcript_38774:272-1492(-)